MGRKKIEANAHLPPYVTARRKKGGKILYYYQRHGKQIPLGDSYENAEERAYNRRVDPLAKPLVVSDVVLLSTEDILASAVQARRCSGIYFLILNGAIAYVGQSADVWTRIGQHLRSRRFDSFAWLPCSEADLDEMEAACIAHFKPWQNDGVRPNFRTRSVNALASD